MARKNKGTKNQKKSVYIVGEGITEQYYFQHLKRLKGFTCIVKPRLFGNTSVWEIEKKIYTKIYKAIDRLKETV
ncbi:MAG: hypothetical protein U2P89_10065 [Proteiniphilum sp.]|uniref:hypothetical protein n=1 Tax=Proteiniphilum sp. TaxID=1926877 RepID=UPI002AB8EDD3|nr:hypothetical protein [Proteiniphilum sp.]MDY9919200.1 hypothetical protein [Proteiniphilum sp.]